MKKLFKYLIFIIFFVSFAIPLSSCGFFDLNNSSSTLPTSSSIDETSEDSREENYFQPLILLNYKVTDLTRYKAPGYGNKSEYLLNAPNQYFTLEINLSNIDKLPITGVLINDTRYEGTSLTSSNDNSQITVKIQSASNYGIQIYEIKKLFYQKDGKNRQTNLSHCHFVLRVQENHLVEATNFTSTLTSSTLKAKFTITDLDHISESLPFNYKLIDKDSENQEIVKNGSIKVGENQLIFDHLKEFTNYELVLYYGRYLNDCGGSEIFIDIAKYTLQTHRAIEIKNIEPSFDNVTFEIDNIEGVTIHQMYLKNLSKDLQEQHTTKMVNEFHDLSSNTDYAIVIEFIFNNQDYVRDFPFKTKAYVAPSFSFKSYDAKCQTISYEVEFTDPLNQGTFINVTLIGPSQQTLRTLKGTFENCRSGTHYQLMLSYSYNLNDGKGPIYKTITEEVDTKRVKTDDILLNLNLNGLNAIDYELDCKNRTDVTLTSIELFANDELKETVTNHQLSGTFSHLVNNQKYLVKANCEIALEGETSNYKYTITNTITTKKLQIPRFDLKITPGRRDASFEVVKDDPDHVFVFYSVMLFKDQKYIAKSENHRDTFSNLLSGHKYVLKLEYKFDYNDNNCPRIETQEYQFTTKTLEEPILSISEVNVGPDYFSCKLNIDDPTQSIDPLSIKAIVSDLNYYHRKTYDIDDYHHIALTNLDSCTTHMLSVTYQYDLNDGEGRRSKSLDYKFRTEDKIIVTYFTVTKNNYSDPELRNFDIDITFKNPDKLNFNRIVINGVTLKLDSIPSTKIHLNIGDIFNSDNFSGKYTLDAFITTTNERYEAYVKFRN